MSKDRRKDADSFNERSLRRGVQGRNNNANVGKALWENSHKKRKKSRVGVYKLEFTEVIDKATQKDIELKEVYARGLIAKFIGVPDEMILLEQKDKYHKITMTAKDEVYYVVVGQITYGKISIREQRLMRDTSLIFIYQTKNTHDVYRKRKSFTYVPRNGVKPTKSEIQQKSRNYRHNLKSRKNRRRN